MNASPERTPVVCGIDIGSTNTKVVVLTKDGAVAARARRTTPRNRSDRSIDATALLTAIEDMMIETCRPDRQIVAVAAAGVGEDGVLVDADLNPLAPALSWFDPRRGPLFEEIRDLLSPAPGIGVSTDPARTLIGWLWARRQAGLDAAACWIALTDFAASHWARGGFISDTLAARTAAWDGRSRSWLTDRVTITLGSVDLLPPVVPTGDPVGHLQSTRLEQAGVLTPTAVVIAGGHDHPVGGWGVHQMHPTAILDSMGTAEVVVAQSPTPNVPRTGTVDVAPGIRSTGTTVLCVEELARNIEWASRQPAVAQALRRLIAGDQAADGCLHSDSFIPGQKGGGTPHYAADAPTDPNSRASAVLGALARLGGAAVDAVRHHMAADAPVYAAGGWARSPGWIDIKHQVTGIAVHAIAEPEVTAVGAALLAAGAIGWDIPAENALDTRSRI